MKLSLSTLFILVLLTSCTSRKSNNTDDLPKDVALKTEREAPKQDTIVKKPNVFETKISLESINTLKNEIDELIASKECTDATKWRISPLGSKPCGGPSSYVAYPKDLEDKILPKITKYNSLVSQYNTQNGLMSDCALVPPPSGIQCQNGKAILVLGEQPNAAIKAE